MEYKCKICGRKPDEIREYISMATYENIAPEEYMIREEGTLNLRTGLFYCTGCYIKIGMPLGTA